MTGKENKKEQQIEGFSEERQREYDNAWDIHELLSETQNDIQLLKSMKIETPDALDKQKVQLTELSMREKRIDAIFEDAASYSLDIKLVEYAVKSMLEHAEDKNNNYHILIDIDKSTILKDLKKLMKFLEESR